MSDHPVMDRLGFVCPGCRGELAPGTASAGWRLTRPGALLHDSGAAAEGPDAPVGASFACTKCALPVIIDASTPQVSVAYPYKRLLAEADWRKYLLWSLAQNNGLVGYVQLESASCSVDDRPDVMAFAAYIADSAPAPGGCILDIGCGPLERPGYLKGFDSSAYRMVGLDPFGSKWDGQLIRGVSEHLPLPDGSVDLISAATSLDHTFDVNASAREIARVLRRSGALKIWDHPLPYGRARVDAVRTRGRELRTRLNHRRHVRVYTDGTVIETPRGMADPFHAKQSRRRSWPKRLDRALTEAGLTRKHYDATEGFSTYTR